MNTNDGEASISRHTARGILPNNYTLVPGDGTGDGDGTVDGTGAAGGLEVRVIFPAILAAIAAYLVS